MRLVASAKSWLSYGGANRTAPILPWGAAESRDFAGGRVCRAPAPPRRRVQQRGREGNKALALAKQDILLTVPASFDEEARELTLRAAQSAGLRNVTLLEEPQAAFYAWLAALGDHWRRRVKVGDLVLVCDVGGGTTDFSLIAVGEHDGDLTLERVAVGEHILLGGDNMDLRWRGCSSSGWRAPATRSTPGSCTASGTRRGSRRNRCSATPPTRNGRSRSSAAARS